MHTIVRYKVVAASSHDFVGGIVEQVIGIKFQYMIRGQIVVKKAGPDVNGGPQIDAVVPEVQENHPFFKVQHGGGAVVLQGQFRSCSYQPGSGAIGQMGQQGVLITAQADMPVPIGE